MDKVLILGSKPFSKLPKYKFSKIYSSNGSANKILTYNNYSNNFKHTCIIGVDHFLEIKMLIKKYQKLKLMN